MTRRRYRDGSNQLPVDGGIEVRPIVITGPTCIARKAAASNQIDRYCDIGRNDDEDRHGQPFEVTRRHSDSRTEQRAEDRAQGFSEGQGR